MRGLIIGKIGLNRVEDMRRLEKINTVFDLSVHTVKCYQGLYHYF